MSGGAWRAAAVTVAGMFDAPVSAAPTLATKPFFSPSLLPARPAVGEEVVVLFGPGQVSSGPVRQVSSVPLGGLVVVDLPAVGPGGQVVSAPVTVPGWCVVRRS